MSRRKSPRLKIGDDLSINFAELHIPCLVRDVSFDGFALETPSPILVGKPHLFRLRSAAQPTLLFMTARASYCRRVPGKTRYISGWAVESIEDWKALAHAVADLICTGTGDR